MNRLRPPLLVLALVFGLAASPSQPLSIVARVGNEAVTADELVRFVDEARGVGYAPATGQELRRMLGGLLRLRVLDREARARGIDAGAEGRAALLSALADDRGRPSVRPSEVNAFLERNPALTQSQEPNSVLRRDVERHLLDVKRRRQLRALADQLVADAPVWVSSEALAALFVARGRTPAAGPPQLPWQAGGVSR